MEIVKGVAVVVVVVVPVVVVVVVVEVVPEVVVVVVVDDEDDEDVLAVVVGVVVVVFEQATRPKANNKATINPNTFLFIVPPIKNIFFCRNRLLIHFIIPC